MAQRLDTRRRIGSISVGFRLIRCLERARRPMPLTELAREASMPTSQAHLYLASFLEEGLVAQDKETFRYQLGPFALQLGMAALAARDDIAVVHKALTELSRATSESGHLSVLGHFGPIIVRKVDGKQEVPVSIKVGHVLPILASATGRIFWAYGNPAALDALPEHVFRMPDGEQPSRAFLEDLRRDIRAKGIAITDSLHNSGFAAISAPVFDHAGDLCCSITLLGPRTVFDSSEDGALVVAVRQSAEGISRQLGYEDHTRECPVEGAQASPA